MDAKENEVLVPMPFRTLDIDLFSYYWSFLEIGRAVSYRCITLVAHSSGFAIYTSLFFVALFSILSGAIVARSYF